MNTRRIVCINKPAGHQNRHEAVLNYGYIVEAESNDDTQATVISRQNMVKWAKIADNKAYVRDSKDPRLIAYCGVNNNGHTEYLQTHADGRWTDNLLNLRECRLS